MGRIQSNPRAIHEGGRRRAARRLGLLGAGLGLGFGLGVLSPFGDTRLDSDGAGPASSSEPLAAASPPPRPAAVADAAAGARPFGPAPSPDLAQTFAAWLAGIEEHGLADVARKVTGAGLDLVAEGVIRRLEDDALASLIASTTDFSSAELAEIDDVPGFALGLARIAMEGSVREAPEPDEDVRPIDFTEEISWDHRAVFAQSQFAADTPRIYAVFESEALGLSETLAKWTRVDDGEILLFERHRIRPAARSSYVYLDAPPAGFPPGEYRVDFYSADRELRWLASGSHRVSL